MSYKLWHPYPCTSVINYYRFFGTTDLDLVSVWLVFYTSRRYLPFRRQYHVSKIESETSFSLQYNLPNLSSHCERLDFILCWWHNNIFLSYFRLGFSLFSWSIILFTLYYISPSSHHCYHHTMFHKISYKRPFCPKHFCYGFLKRLFSLYRHFISLVSWCDCSNRTVDLITSMVICSTSFFNSLRRKRPAPPAPQPLRFIILPQKPF